MFVKGSHMLNDAVLRVLYRMFVYFERLYGAQLWSLLSKYACLLNSYRKGIFVCYFDKVSTKAVLLLPTPDYTGSQ